MHTTHFHLFVSLNINIIFKHDHIKLIPPNVYHLLHQSHSSCTYHEFQPNFNLLCQNPSSHLLDISTVASSSPPPLLPARLTNDSNSDDRFTLFSRWPDSLAAARLFLVVANYNDFDETGNFLSSPSPFFPSTTSPPLLQALIPSSCSFLVLSRFLI